MRKILVTTNFETEDENALKMAVDMAKVIDGKIYLIHFFQHPLPTFSATGDTALVSSTEESIYALEVIRSAKSKLALLASHYQQEEVSIDYQVVDNNLMDGAESFVDEHDIDILFTAADAHEAKKMVDNCACIVLASKKYNTIDKLRNIVLSIDINLDRDRREAIKFLQELAYHFRSIIHVVHVTQEKEKDKILELRSKLRLFSKKYFFRGYSLNILNHEKDEEEALLSYGKNVNAGLYMVLSDRNKGFLSFFSTSLTKHLMEDAEVPVMSANLDNL